MFLAYVYKLRPNKTQQQTIERWLNLLRAQYNFRLGERIEAYEQVRSPKLGEYCDIQTQAVATPLACKAIALSLIHYSFTGILSGEV